MTREEFMRPVLEYDDKFEIDFYNWLCSSGRSPCQPN